MGCSAELPRTAGSRCPVVPSHTCINRSFIVRVQPLHLLLYSVYVNTRFRQRYPFIMNPPFWCHCRWLLAGGSVCFEAVPGWRPRLWVGAGYKASANSLLLLTLEKPRSVFVVNVRKWNFWCQKSELQSARLAAMKRAFSLYRNKMRIFSEVGNGFVWPVLLE